MEKKDSKYPDWVNEHKRKGTEIKKVGNSYYLYKATSKRVKGKKYPQPISKFIGAITKEGVVSSQVRKISTDDIMVYEYGFSYALKSLLPAKFIEDFKSPERAEMVFLNMVKHLSPSSYLLRGHDDLPSEEELHVNIAMQIRKYERLAKIEIKELYSLKGLYLIATKECDLLSKQSEEIRVLLQKIGVKINESE